MKLPTTAHIKKPRYANLIDIIFSVLLQFMRRFPLITQTSLGFVAARKSLHLSRRNDCWDIASGNRSIRLSKNHFQYVLNIIDNFEYYHSSVEPTFSNGVSLVDFSEPKIHKIIGCEQQGFLFQSIVEPISTAQLYLELAHLETGEFVLDLGAYSGFTSILFDQVVASSGRVIAIDADPQNSECIRANLLNYKTRTGRDIQFISAAIWKNSGVIEFSSEGSVGSYAQDIKGYARGNSNNVPAITLIDMQKLLNFERVDFIKCDVEGAEAVIFNQPEFFALFRPRIVIEVHKVGGSLTTNRCRDAIAQFGYTFREFKQSGSSLPLLQCLPME